MSVLLWSWNSVLKTIRFPYLFYLHEGEKVETYDDKISPDNTINKNSYLCEQYQKF